MRFRQALVWRCCVDSVEALQDGRIFIELINGPMLFEHKAALAEYGADRGGWRCAKAGLREVPPDRHGSVCLKSPTDAVYSSICRSSRSRSAINSSIRSLVSGSVAICLCGSAARCADNVGLAEAEALFAALHRENRTNVEFLP
jgi:hypothetical protein